MPPPAPMTISLFKSLAHSPLPNPPYHTLISRTKTPGGSAVSATKAWILPIIAAKPSARFAGRGRSSMGVATGRAGEKGLLTRKWAPGGGSDRGQRQGGANGYQHHQKRRASMGSLQDGRHQSKGAAVDGEEEDIGIGSGGLGNGFSSAVKKKQPAADGMESKFLTLPTVLTLGRVAAVPLLVSTFYVDRWWSTTATTVIFLTAAVTDWLDGYIARKMRLGTAFGAFLDPVADKLMVAATLVLLCTRPLEISIFGQAPWILTVPSIAIIGREITMSAVREWAASQDTRVLEAVAVNNLGKWKTATQMTALTILLATRDASLTGPGVLASGIALLYISGGLSLWSLFVYMRNIWRILLK